MSLLKRIVLIDMFLITFRCIQPLVVNACKRSIVHELAAYNPNNRDGKYLVANTVLGFNVPLSMYGSVE